MTSVDNPGSAPIGGGQGAHALSPTSLASKRRCTVTVLAPSRPSSRCRHGTILGRRLRFMNKIFLLSLKLAIAIKAACNAGLVFPKQRGGNRT
jgi:hypothetical protein